MTKLKKVSSKVKSAKVPVNYPVILVRATSIVVGQDCYEELISQHATAPQVLSDEQKTQLNTFMKTHSFSESQSYRVDVGDADEMNRIIARGKKLLDSDKKAEIRRVAAYKKRQENAERARKLKRLKRLEALASQS